MGQQRASREPLTLEPFSNSCSSINTLHFFMIVHSFLHSLVTSYRQTLWGNKRGIIRYVALFQKLAIL